jgi:LAO/AO transport system kinase
LASNATPSLAEKVIAGDIRAAARLMRDIDDEMPGAADELKRLYPRTGRAYLLGITGLPGAGKSTLVDRVIERFRKQGLSVGIVVIDPTSPFSGGAILGDRIRMARHFTDAGVFIRSLATRGHLGGLSSSTNDVINVMDAMGKDVVIVETVGVGQDETEIVSTAHTTVVVLTPGMGDEIQAIKAGVLEVGDVFVVNKANREGSDRAVRDIETMLDMTGYRDDEFRPPVVKTEALADEGIDEVMEAIAAHRAFIESGGGLSEKRRERARYEFLELLRDGLFAGALAAPGGEEGLAALYEAMAAREKDPYTEVGRIIAEVLKGRRT